MLNWNNIYWRIASRRGVLAELSRATHLNVLRPRMLSGNLQKAVPENDMSDDWRPSGAGDRGHTRGMPLFRWLPGWRKGSAAHD